jgi:sugar lactone lactonase YvrE
MTRLLVRIVLLWSFVCAAAALTRAASATFWTVATQAEFLKGDATNLAIDRDGRLTLGPAIEQIAETSAPVLWAVVPANSGSADQTGYFVGSGNEGKVLRVGPDGKVSVFFDAGELEVHALAAAPDGGLYAGTSPDGKVYRISADGKSTVLFDPEDRYIWALVTDANGTLFVATGDKGVIYRVTPDGKGTAFYRTRATHAMALGVDREGRLLAGTGSPGRVFRIDTTGKGFVLLDSPHREVRALRLGPDGSVYAAALSDRPASSGGDAPSDRGVTEPQRTATPSVSTEITAIAIVDASQAAGSAVPQPRETRPTQERGAVYRILPDGVSDVVWDAEQDLPYDLAVDAQGRILVATGAEGRLFQTSPSSMSATLLGRVGAQQVTAIFDAGSGAYLFATANPGKLFRLSATRAARGTYQSDVRDATTVASWGTISWRGQANGGRIEISTRTGNTATPDDTWSEWSPPYRNPQGDTVVSPKARYLQWRAVLVGDQGDRSPVLTSVTTAYLPRNLRPDVESITVHPAGTVFQKPFSTGEFEIAGFDVEQDERRQAAAAQAGQTPVPMLGRRMYQKGLQTFAWKAEDPNEDRLQYDVLYRREGDTAWKLLKRALSDAIVVWDTTSVPDGTYVIKIAASDAPSNSPGTALTGERESTSFEIDNTPPRITVASQGGDGARIRFSVADDHSPVQRVEYSLEGERWRVVYPTDGIPDSRMEQFEIELGGIAGRAVTIRATDAMNNTATVTELRIKN